VSGGVGPGLHRTPRRIAVLLGVLAALVSLVRAAESRGFHGNVLVARGGEPLLLAGYGIANHSTGARYSPATLVQIGWQALPEMSDRLAHIEPFVGTPEEADALRQAYELMPRANFSKNVLEACPDALAVSQLPRLVWSDLGSPHRVLEAVTRMRTRPEWARTLAPSA